VIFNESCISKYIQIDSCRVAIKLKAKRMYVVLNNCFIMLFTK
jgi:hypothetical protein